jgi:peptide/nickel transport system ATP-binding protein
VSIWMLDSTSGALFTSPRLRGEVGLRASAIRVRGAIREFDYAETAPHPNPLRASFARLDPVKNGEREFLPAHAISLA